MDNCLAQIDKWNQWSERFFIAVRWRKNSIYTWNIFSKGFHLVQWGTSQNSRQYLIFWRVSKWRTGDWPSDSQHHLKGLEVTSSDIWIMDVHFLHWHQPEIWNYFWIIWIISLSYLIKHLSFEFKPISRSDMFQSIQYFLATGVFLMSKLICRKCKDSKFARELKGKRIIQKPSC